MFDPSLWFLFPVAMVISTIAMMSGSGGAILFSPFFIFVLKIEPVTAIAAGLFIEFFGFSSGVVGYLRKRDIDFTLVKMIIFYSLPATVVGVYVSHFISGSILKGILFVLLVILTITFLKPLSFAKKFFHIPCQVFSSIGAFILGLTSSGFGEINEYLFLKQLKLRPALAAGTSVFLVASSALIGIIVHAILFLQDTSIFEQIVPLILFSIPGVIIGAQIGVRLVEYISKERMNLFLGILFFFLSILIFFMLY